MKKIFKILIIFLILSMVLDFIPIKWATKIEDIKHFKTNEYLCSFAQVTGGNWQVINNTEKYDNNQLYFDIYLDLDYLLMYQLTYKYNLLT